MTSTSPRSVPDRADTEAAFCAHCSLPLAGAPVVQRVIGAGTESFCCLGCAFIAEQLHLAGARSRDPVGVGDEANTRSASDGGSVSASTQSAASPAQQQMHPQEQIRLCISGMVCSACAALIESRLRRHPGVVSAQVDFAARRAWIVFDRAHESVAHLCRAIERYGYSASVALDRERERRSARVDLARTLYAWLAMMQVMMLAAPSYFAAAGEVSADLAQLLRIAQLVLTTPVILFSSAPLFRAAVNQLRTRTPGMDIPLALGLAAAFAASVWATLVASGAVYFDSITMFVAFVLGSRWLQARALAHARAEVDAVERAARQPAQRLRVWPRSLACDSLAADALVPGDHIVLAPGEAAAADGVVVRGASTISLAWVSGEAAPMPVREGQPLLAGSVNLEQPLVLRVTRSGSATSLALLGRMVNDAGAARPRVVELGNRIGAFFLMLILVVSATTFASWLLLAPEPALAPAVTHALAVLIACCPCALSLAAPAALAAAQSRLARAGVLTARSAALETLARADVLVMDKTGTLTDCNPQLQQVIVLRPDAVTHSAALSLAAALEAASSHPFARALLAAAAATGVSEPAARDLRAVAGAGVEGVIDGRIYRLGMRSFALGACQATEAIEATEGTESTKALGADRGEDQIALHTPANANVPGTAATQSVGAMEEIAAASTVYLADSKGLLAAFEFGERLRDDARELLAVLRVNAIAPQILSGDGLAPVRKLARELGIDESTQVNARQTAADKRDWITRRQSAGGVVAMIGDGMNDAPAIARADVSFALGAALGGAALAQACADFIVTRPRLAAVGAAITTARKTMRIARQNFCWAVAYNVVAIALAALGYLTPAVAAIGMAASSLLVVGNALRLLAARPVTPRAGVDA